MSVTEIVDYVCRYQPYYETTNGGVTLSGGEPTLHMEFISRLLKRMKEKGINTLLQTSGFFHLKTFTALVLPYVDTIHFDIKLIDPVEHKKFCGVKNERIINNFIALHNKASAENFKIKPRTPLIPGITDTDANMNGIAKFYNEHRIRKAVLQLNNPVWIDKFNNLGKKTSANIKDQLGKFYNEDKLLMIKKIFLQRGIEIFVE